MRFVRLVSILAATAVAAFVFNIGSSDADAQAGPPSQGSGGTRVAAATGPTIGWTTYGANLASHRYPPADQITRLGARVIAGMEGSVDRWTVGLEGELDLTSGTPLDRFPGKDLLPTGRVGVAIRRHF